MSAPANDVLAATRLSLAAVEAATGAAHMLMISVRDGGPIDVADVLTPFCDGLQSVLRIEHRPEDGQLLAAVEKWQDEVGLDVYGEGRP